MDIRMTTKKEVLFESPSKLQNITDTWRRAECTVAET